MKNVFPKASVVAAACLLVAGCTDKLADDFASPPDTMTTGVYWYWMSDNISKEGVIKDLQAMKQAGINAAFIGNIGGEGAPYGEVKIFSDEWWDVLHTAMKTAGELGIEIGLFNCPGWSHSGGPWIEAGQSMRHLVASETQVAGGGKVTIKLPVPAQPTQYKDWSDEFINHEGKPSSYFQDVRTLAVPVPEDYRLNLFDAPGARVSTTNLRPLVGASLDRPVHDAPTTSPLHEAGLLGPVRIIR
jgi:hypothetical protein